MNYELSAYRGTQQQSQELSGAQKSLIWLRFRYCCMVSMESCEKFACDYIR
eukprot:COSAG01_NODE_1120_length_11632_cov_50.655770_13_plen_50_part_01